MHNVLCRSVTIEARFTASSRSSGSHRDWTDLYRASNSVMWAFPICTDCVTIFLNVVARDGTVRWNRYITPDLCLATSWLHDLIYHGHEI
jgi:hypothetical protein